MAAQGFDPIWLGVVSVKLAEIGVLTPPVGLNVFVVARATKAALRNDANEARRELMTLAPADRADAQSWLDKADARDAALAASRQFAADAMAAFAKPAQ